MKSVLIFFLFWSQAYGTAFEAATTAPDVSQNHNISHLISAPATESPRQPANLVESFEPLEERAEIENVVGFLAPLLIASGLPKGSSIRLVNHTFRLLRLSPRPPPVA